ncbi:MAG: MBL fold metallo-hydrolase, partial [Ilumatobacter sp.]|nr:MBL fold metallo-hydrolase [Ilumatobacter sp.]
PAEVAPGVRRVIAENPSKFTYHGTGTYLIGSGSSVAVVDPGPRLDGHLDALLRALAGETVTAILVTHCHADHSPLAARLREETGAPTYAFGPHGDTGEVDLGTLPDDFGRPPPDAAGGDTPTNDPPLEEGHDLAFRPDVECRTGDTVAAGPGWRVTAIHTPGHTSNHTCF